MELTRSVIMVNMIIKESWKYCFPAFLHIFLLKYYKFSAEHKQLGKSKVRKREQIGKR